MFRSLIKRGRTIWGALRSPVRLGVLAGGGALLLTLLMRMSNAPGRLSASHSGLACASCHSNTVPAAADACGGCHGAQRSTRAPHAHLLANGEMGCTTCHSAHRPNDNAVVQRGALVARVPLIPKSACAQCHRPDDIRDPSARCFSGATSECFDEHGLKRAAFWPTPHDRERQMAAAETPFAGAIPPLASLGVAALLVATRKRKRSTNVVRTAPRVRYAKPLPVIDPTTCLGCSACVDACAFDVLEIKEFVARVVRPEGCCGAATCAEVCPNQSLKIHEKGDPSDALRLSDAGESLAVPGIYLAGDVSGVPLIKNAVAGGAQAVRHIASRVKHANDTDDALDVLIVGAGPAGLSAALCAKELGLSYAVLERSTIAATVREFPRAKLVFEQPLAMPVEGNLWFRECTKEELIGEWTRIVRQNALRICEHEQVVSIESEKGRFVVASMRADGTTQERVARHVVLAIGRRGEPRRLPVDIAEGAASMVRYSLVDAAAYAGARVLVVGLGDSAMEAICALAEQPGTQVIAAHRGETFGRGSAKNVAAVERLVRLGKVRIHFNSEVISVSPQIAVLRRSGEEPVEAEVDVVLALLGGESPRKWLESIGVWPKSTPGKIVSEGDAFVRSPP